VENLESKAEAENRALKESSEQKENYQVYPIFLVQLIIDNLNDKKAKITLFRLLRLKSMN
jgi:hypothetical protein